MAIYTPRGLKIRLSVAEAFALMKRLYPSVKPFKILKTVEGIEYIPAFLSTIAALIAFAFEMAFPMIIILVTLAYISGVYMNTSGFYLVPGIISLSTYFSYIPGIWVVEIGIIIFGFIVIGWKASVAFVVGRLIGWITQLVIEHSEMHRVYNTTGLIITASERFFFNAYRNHAVWRGKSTDITCSEEELSKENWWPIFKEFAREWPEIAYRYSIDEAHFED
ncbi:MAG TPA: hypothetical protein ENO22_12345 [candidate division Zixibacteria bacterium]|nr:hypothetical protein [candidate division Zixibacteria bacterium]